MFWLRSSCRRVASICLLRSSSGISREIGDEAGFGRLHMPAVRLLLTSSDDRPGNVLLRFISFLASSTATSLCSTGSRNFEVGAPQPEMDSFLVLVEDREEDRWRLVVRSLAEDRIVSHSLYAFSSCGRNCSRNSITISTREMSGFIVRFASELLASGCDRRWLRTRRE